MGKCKAKPNYRRTVLRLPDLDHSKLAVLNSLTSPGSRRVYLHRNSENLGVIITRTDSSPHQSYLVGLTGKTRLTHCGDWYAPRFPAFPIGDVNPPCLLSGGSDKSKADDGVSSTLIARPGFVEFYTVQGRKVTASW